MNVDVVEKMASGATIEDIISGEYMNTATRTNASNLQKENEKASGIASVITLLIVGFGLIKVIGMLNDPLVTDLMIGANNATTIWNLIGISFGLLTLLSIWGLIGMLINSMLSGLFNSVSKI